MKREFTKLIAHGGYSSKYPENTKEAYLKALEFQPEGVEMDISFYNGAFYAYHPKAHKKSYGQETDKVIEGELKKILNNGKEVLKLSDIKAELLQKTQFILADLKQKNKRYTELFIKEIEMLQLRKDQVVIGCRDFEKLKLIKNHQEKCLSLGLMSDPEDYKRFVDMGGDFFRLFEKDVEPKLIKEIQKYGCEVWVTPGRRQTATQKRTAGEIRRDFLEELIHMKVDAILVNDIKMAVKVRSEIIQL